MLRYGKQFRKCSWITTLKTPLLWTADREYTTKSAYRVQFEGTFSKLKIMPIWKAVTEPKYRFFFRMDIAAQEDSHRK